ncbi:hypothetical protein EYZ11_001546 [Aspergillus tanneri]|uniref:Uncharacterized protein n=1 Tax=Aspergillus tanneri TaxID=1220188 RepID=A0A4S3JUE3_9EURO|nr:uncharacterized protein ATNIH1004_007573 [Aspergillus tanneri]KAA8646147.1 hypothetical protein ATNIH1004_007573 [Aspergillus tanneri]THC98995.1 hypothetical protein EYZ11_001546 [Aspergillus tanneri]
MVSMVETSWPPKSPREALLSSPSGRKKYQKMLQRRAENLGSPLKHSTPTPNLRTKTQRLLDDGMDELDEDEDEETLHLKLEAIKAQLRLKQLQKSRGKSSTAGSGTHEVDKTFSRPTSAISFTSQPSDFTAKSPGARFQSDEVQVPLSPTRRPVVATESVSPRRVILGIDKGRKGGEVSLKRPPMSKTTTRPTSRLGSRDGLGSHTQPLADGEAKKIKSFSERMAESRSTDKLRRERVERSQANRSVAFQFDKAEMEAFKAAAAETRATSPVRSPTRRRQAESFSREDVLRSFQGNSPAALRRSQTAPSARKHGNADPAESRSYFHRRNHKSESSAPSSQASSFTKASSDESVGGRELDLDKTPDSSKFESFSSLHLSNRILPHSFLSRTLADKKVLQIPDLLRTVKGPAFELPEDIDGDYVVFGIVASKSEPKQVKESKNVSAKENDPFDDGLQNTNQYMAITLTDLKWTIDLFLFDTAFPRYYRLSEGIVIAILNPTIMPPPRHKLDTNKFSLSISSSDDTVLEVGFAQDIGFCKAVKKDGKTCHSWVDGRKTEFCDFHVDLQVRRTQAQRMGVNSGTGMFGPGGRSGPRTGFFGGGKRGDYKSGLKANGAQYDMQTQSVYYIAPAPKTSHDASHPFSNRPRGQSAASLIDADHDDPFIAAGMMSRGSESKEERFRKRLLEQKRERDIAQKLSTSRGPGIGADYLRARQAENAPSSPSVKQMQNKSNADATSQVQNLGLGGLRKAGNVKLSPLKRAHDGDKSHGSVKKTRFITAKGIKEAGRDSLGGKTEAATTKTTYDDDDDDLEII